jgi:hypothetical protein
MLGSRGIQRVSVATRRREAPASAAPAQLRALPEAEQVVMAWKGAERVSVEPRRREAPASAAPAQLRALPEAEQM